MSAVHQSDLSQAKAPSYLRDRLVAAKKTVREATEEALKSASSENTLSGVVLGPASSHTFAGEIDGLSFEAGGTESTQDPGGNNGENDDPNVIQTTPSVDDGKSFELGMTLFGDDVAMIEREISAKLERVEEELRDIIASEPKGQGKDGAIKVADDAVMTEADEASMEEEARSLSVKIKFLRKCSTARSLLDESTTLSLSTGGGGIVESANLLSKAEGALAEAERGVNEASSASSKGGGDLEAARRILDSIQVQIRRKRVDLLARTSSILDSCILITPTSISVRGLPSTDGQIKSGSKGARVEGLEAAYDAIEALSLASEEQEDGSSSKLHETVHLLYTNLYSIVLKPLLSSVAAGSAQGPWNFRESTTVDSASLFGQRAPAVSTSIKGPSLTLEWTHGSSPEGSSSSSSKTAKQYNSDNVVTWGEALKFIGSIMGFVHERVLLGRPALCRMMGHFLFGDHSQKNPSLSNSIDLDGLGLDSGRIGDQSGQVLRQMVRIMWDTCLPSSVPPDELSSLHDVAEKFRSCTDEFEGDMMKNGFMINVGKAGSAPVENDESDTSRASSVSPLSAFVDNFERKYAEKRRVTILAAGRKLLLSMDYHNTVEVGVDVRKKKQEDSFDFGDEVDGMSVFMLHKCAISQVASSLMEMCKNTMDEAVAPHISSKSSSLALLPPTLYRTSRELLDLFRAIIPASHGSEVSTIPRTAAVLHNDCVYFAHNLLTLGHEYKERFPPVSGDEDTRGTLLRQMCTFVDLVPPFRELAGRALGDMIERQKVELLNVVGSRITMMGEALRSNESLMEWTDAETALTAGLYHFRHLSQAWRPILSAEVYDRAMGNLVDTLFTLYLDQVLTKTTDISEPASHFVSSLFRGATRGISELFDASSPQAGTETARKSCNLWDRFVAVGRFMDMNLSDINLALAEGVFRSVTGPELSRLISAAFDDSEKRRQLLSALAAD